MLHGCSRSDALPEHASLIRLHEIPGQGGSVDETLRVSTDHHFARFCLPVSVPARVYLSVSISCVSASSRHDANASSSVSLCAYVHTADKLASHTKSCNVVWVA
jgi:hypothetical protein